MSPLRRGLRSPPPTHTGAVCTHKQPGGGGDASHLGVGTHAAPPASTPLYTPHSPPCSHPPAPTQKTLRNQTANTAQIRDSDRPLPDCLEPSIEKHTRLSCAVSRTPPPAISRHRHAALRGPRPSPQPKPSPPTPRPPFPMTGARDSYLLVLLMNPSRSPPHGRSGHSPPRGGFSEPVK